jgi:hypothetical protein
MPQPFIHNQASLGIEKVLAGEHMLPDHEAVLI